MTDSLPDIVIRIVKKHANKKRLARFDSADALRKARLYHDLDIYGDDAFDMFLELHEEFFSDFSEVNTAARFPPEFFSLNPFLHSWRTYVERKRLRQGKSTYVPITVGELIGFIESCSPRNG